MYIDDIQLYYSCKKTEQHYFKDKWYWLNNNLFEKKKIVLKLNAEKGKFIVTSESFLKLKDI